MSVKHAIQVGPVLVDPSGVRGNYWDVGGQFNRSAACLREGSLTVFVVEGRMSLFQSADLLSLPKATDGFGFGFDIAINLDGEPSTQAALRAGSARTEITRKSTV